jgi:hypothetical protein
VAQCNESNGYDAEDDGGFIAIHAYSRDELESFLTEMGDTVEGRAKLGPMTRDRTTTRKNE